MIAVLGYDVADRTNALALFLFLFFVIMFLEMLMKPPSSLRVRLFYSFSKDFISVQPEFQPTVTGEKMNSPCHVFFNLVFVFVLFTLQLSQQIFFVEDSNPLTQIFVLKQHIAPTTQPIVIFSFLASSLQDAEPLKGFVPTMVYPEPNIVLSTVVFDLCCFPFAVSTFLSRFKVLLIHSTLTYCDSTFFTLNLVIANAMFHSNRVSKHDIASAHQLTLLVNPTLNPPSTVSDSLFF